MSTTPRNYAYIRALVKRANAASSVQVMIRNNAQKIEFETKHAAQIAEAWRVLEEQANKGSIRTWIRDHPVLQQGEIQSYLASKGFSVSNDTVEWWHEPKEPQLR